MEFCEMGELSFRYVKTFNMDEYVGLPRDHPESYHSYMWENFFKDIDIEPKNAHILDGNADDLDEECNNFEKMIKEAGGVHLFIGGTLFSKASLFISSDTVQLCLILYTFEFFLKIFYRVFG